MPLWNALCSFSRADACILLRILFVDNTANAQEETILSGARADTPPSYLQLGARSKSPSFHISLYCAQDKKRDRRKGGAAVTAPSLIRKQGVGGGSGGAGSAVGVSGAAGGKGSGVEGEWRTPKEILSAYEKQRLGKV